MNNTLTKPTTAESHATPKGLLDYSQRFLKHAHGTTGPSPVDPFAHTYPVLDYLVGRSIELALKAFLLGEGVPMDVLRKKPFRHDLSALRLEATRRGIENHVELTSEHYVVIDLLSEPYSNKELEYQGEGSRVKQPLEREALLGAAKALTTGLEYHCAEATNRIRAERAAH